jgi:hypothetical protein
MNFARNAGQAAIITALSVVGATAKPVATTGETNLRKAAGTDSEIVTLIAKGTTVEVGDCKNGWCQVSWNGQDGYVIARNLGMGTAPRRPRAATAGEGYDGYGYGPPPPGYVPAPYVVGPPAYYGYPYAYRPYYGYGPYWGWRRGWW